MTNHINLPRNLFSYSLILFLMIVLNTGCSKQEFQNEFIQNDPVTEVSHGMKYLNGRLIFSDFNAFNEKMQELKNTQDATDQFYAQIPGFVSSNMQYQRDLANFDNNKIKSIEDIANYKSLAIRTRSGEQEVVPAIDAVLLSYLANHDNILQIGEILYCFTYSNAYEIPMDKVVDTKHGVIYDINNAQKVYPILRSIDQQVDDGSRAIPDEFTHNYYSCAIDRRFYGNMETTDAGVYLEIRLTTKHQKKSLGVWVGESVTSITTIGEGEYTGPYIADPTHYTYDVNKTLSNKNDANHVISSIGALGGDLHYSFVSGTCDNTHKFNKDCSGGLYTNYTNN